MTRSTQVVYSSRTADKFVVRLPDGMREQIADVAKDNHRSMNSEIISRLKKSLDTPDSDGGTVEVDGEGVLWNPSLGMLVKTPDGIGAIEGVHYASKDNLDTVMIAVDGESYRLSDVKPIWLKS